MSEAIVRVRMTVGALLVAAAVCATARPAVAIEPRALAPFQVQAPDGSSVGSGQVALPGRQVVIYVDAGCAACARMFAVLDGLDADEVGGVTFIVRGDAASAARLMAKLPPALAAVRWFTDERGAAHAAMKLQTTPTVLGLWSGRIHWARPGSADAPGDLASALRAWLGPTAPDDPKP